MKKHPVHPITKFLAQKIRNPRHFTRWVRYCPREIVGYAREAEYCPLALWAYDVVMDEFQTRIDIEVCQHYVRLWVDDTIIGVIDPPRWAMTVIAYVDGLSHRRVTADDMLGILDRMAYETPVWRQFIWHQQQH